MNDYDTYPLTHSLFGFSADSILVQTTSLLLHLMPCLATQSCSLSNEAAQSTTKLFSPRNPLSEEGKERPPHPMLKTLP